MDMSLSKLQEIVKEAGLARCRPWGYQELDMTERVNWTELRSTPLPEGNYEIWNYKANTETITLMKRL